MRSLRDAVGTDLGAIEPLLADDVQWYGPQDARAMLAQGEAPRDDEAVLFYLYSRDLAALRDHLVANGLTPGEIVDGSPGPREEMRVTDPDGYFLMIAQIFE